MKKILSLLISFFPINRLRIFFLRFICGYNVDYSSSIGMFNIIDSEDFVAENSKIGNFNYIESKSIFMQKAVINKCNRIKHLNTLNLAQRSIIFSWNFISGSKISKNIINQNLYLGEDSEILRSNYFDINNTIYIGKNVVFGGNGSEIWTHGFTTDRTMLIAGVEFGNNIFIGSNCIFTKGVHIVDDVVIGPGSVVYKPIKESGFYTTQQLIKFK